MTTYSYPSIRPSSQSWALRNFTAVHQSPLNASISTQDRDGEHWIVDMAYADLFGSNRRALEAFLFKLNGSQHRFTMQDFSYVRAGAGGGTPLVNGASQTGKNLVIDGGPNSQSGWLLAGDKISVAGLLHSVDADVNTDGTGNATIIVSPRIFAAPTNNDPVEIDTPTSSFVLVVDSLAVSTRPPDIAQIGFQAMSSL